MHRRSLLSHIISYGLLIMMLLMLSASNVNASVRAYLNYVIFHSPGQGPYIELYLSIDGASVNFNKLDDDRYAAEIEVTLIFRQDDKIVDFDKYILRSRDVSKAEMEKVSILDQQRYFLPEGRYDFEISLNDIFSEEEPFTTLQKIELQFSEEEVTLSGIQLADSIARSNEDNILTKSGYDILPRVHNFYPKGVDKLRFYSEIYNTGRQFGQEKFLVRCMIRSFESDQVLDEYVSQKIMDPEPVIPFLNEIDISALPTGYYLLAIEIRDKNNTPVSANAIFFERDNPGFGFGIDKLSYYDVSRTFASEITEQDTLNEYLRSLVPRATQMEQQFIFDVLEKDDLKMKQKFFYHFWYSRNRENPLAEWRYYQEQVAVVNERYSTQIAKGYDTDRGRVYLKYGPPNIISESYNEPSSYPYEIWHYYKLGKRQSNKKFVFYSHDIITNDFWLLHSDAIGEISNYRWQMILNQRWYDPQNIDMTQPPDIWGSKASDYFRNPR